VCLNNPYSVNWEVNLRKFVILRKDTESKKQKINAPENLGRIKSLQFFYAKDVKKILLIISDLVDVMSCP